jgi:hypothetical protein
MDILVKPDYQVLHSMSYLCMADLQHTLPDHMDILVKPDYQVLHSMSYLCMADLQHKYFD